MKIVIVGRGLAGCFTASYFQYYSSAEVELIYDSSIPALPVGQATVLDAPRKLWDMFRPAEEDPKMNWYDNPLKGTMKTGILYENWGKKHDKFFHPFPNYLVATHYSTDALQDYICKHSGFKVTDQKVSSLEEIDADYIFDCRGIPKDFKDYDELVSPVNSVLLGRKEEIKPTQHWTRAVATPNGWAFDIPLTDHTSLGYIYNSDITSIKDATANFNEMFDNPQILGVMDTPNYVAKAPFIDDRTILNGCKLFFLEPLEATAISVYLSWIELCFDHIILKKITADQATQMIKLKIQQVQNFILYHYGFGSKWDTEFWRYAKTMEQNKLTDPEFWGFMNYSSSTHPHWNSDEKETNMVYGVHQPLSFRNMHDGLGG